MTWSGSRNVSEDFQQAWKRQVAQIRHHRRDSRDSAAFLSTVIPAGGAQQPQDSSAEDAARVERELEQRLTDIISQIDGVTSPQVMVTLDRTSERVFAEEVKSSSSGDSLSSENSPALTGSKDALEKSVILPKVRGVAVVCGGAENMLVREKVVNTAARVLDIGVSQVYVTN